MEPNNPEDGNADDHAMPEGGGDEFVDETPEFLTAADAVEVQVDEENEPMDEEEEEDDDGAEGGADPSNEISDAVPVQDMATVKLTSHQGPVYAVTAHLDPVSNELTIVSGGGDDRAFLYRISPPTSTNQNSATRNTSEPATISLEHAHTDSVSCVALNSPYISDDVAKTPRLAAVGAYDGAIIIYDPDTGKKMQALEGPTDVEWLAFHPKGGTVLLAGSAEDNTIWMFHIPMKKCLQVFVGHENAVTAGTFSPDGRWVLTASSDGTVRIWAPRTGVSKHVFRLGTDGAGMTCMDINGGTDGQLLIVGAEDGQAHVCHVGTKKVVASLRHFEPNAAVAGAASEEDEMELPMSVEAVGFAATTVNPNWCASGGVDGVLKIWDLANDGMCRQVCRQESTDGSENGGITRLKWHPSLPLVFACTTVGMVHVWDARNGQLVHSVTGSTQVINDMNVTFTKDGKHVVVVAGSDDSIVRVFDLDLIAILGA